MSVLIDTDEYFPIDDNVIGYIANNLYYCSRENLKVFIDPILKILFLYIINPIVCDDTFPRGIQFKRVFFKEFKILEPITLDNIPIWLKPDNRYTINDKNIEKVYLPKEQVI